MSKINWDDIAQLESIANQCIYIGKEVGQARAALKAIYGYDIEYEDEKDDGFNPFINKNNKDENKKGDH